jgi:hypothetical protein
MPTMAENPFQRPPSNYPTSVTIDPINQTRILILHPGHGDSEIQCHVSVISIKPKSSTEYDALSYVWGDWTNHGKIRFNGIPNFPVTRNLYLALRRLRKRDKECNLWIDQATINEQNEKKPQQVAQVGHIFGLACQVMI